MASPSPLAPHGRAREGARTLLPDPATILQCFHLGIQRCPAWWQPASARVPSPLPSLLSFHLFFLLFPLSLFLPDAVYFFMFFSPVFIWTFCLYYVIVFFCFLLRVMVTFLFLVDFGLTLPSWFYLLLLLLILHLLPPLSSNNNNYYGYC